MSFNKTKWHVTKVHFSTNKRNVTTINYILLMQVIHFKIILIKIVFRKAAKYLKQKTMTLALHLVAFKHFQLGNWNDVREFIDLVAGL